MAGAGVNNIYTYYSCPYCTNTYQLTRKTPVKLGANALKSAPAVNSLDMAGHLLRRLHQQSTQTFAQRTQMAGFDLTQVQFAALDAIRAHPGIDQAGVAERIAYDRATIGGVIERLEQKGWILRTVSERDRRARVLSLTEDGETMFAALLPVVQALQIDILEPLSAEERAQFLAMARQVIDG